MRNLDNALREVVTGRRIVGFLDAVKDLGTHRMCGVSTYYSCQAVGMLLRGKSSSKKLMRRIIDNRPDLLELSIVADETKELARSMGWEEGAWGAVIRGEGVTDDTDQKKILENVRKRNWDRPATLCGGVRQIAKTGAMA